MRLNAQEVSRVTVTAAVAALVLLVLLAVAATPAAAGPHERKLQSSLSKSMGQAGSGSSAFVETVAGDRSLYSRRGGERRMLASNTKLFTTAAALADRGPDARLTTAVRGEGGLAPDGVWQGDLYLVGGGDPTFGTRSYADGYGSEADFRALVDDLAAAGIERVKGRIRGDESRYDSLRGGPASNFATSIFVGPLSALSSDRGVDEGGFFQSNPASYAAALLTRELEEEGIGVRGRAKVGRAPSNARLLAAVQSPPLASLVRITNKFSDNFFAELLLKELAARPAAEGSTTSGARRAKRFARGLGVRARLVDGSGLSRGNNAPPREVAELLSELARRPALGAEYDALYESLAIAGVDGTLDGRMEGRAARGRCHAKTGTLTGVSALSGYCESRGGELISFSILMNGVDVTSARRLQDRMANAIARYRG